MPGLIANIVYDARGNTTNVTRQNSASTLMTYVPERGWLDTVLTTSAAEQDPIQDLDYSRDALGRITAVASPDAGESWTYGYDDLDRLTSADNTSDNTLDQTFTYDLVGNMLTNSQVGTYSYPAAGSARPHAVTGISGGPLGTQSFTYDANGSMTVQGPDTRSYDGENRLVTAVDGATTQFVYGPDGARIKKTASGATTLYFGDDVEVIPGASPQYTKYLPGDAKRVTQGAVTTSTWLHRDHLRSVRAITNAAGAIVDRANYRPFGEQLGFATATESKGYIGELHDDETGLLYLHARYYDPVLGRFVQADPMDPTLPGVGVNRYSYASNNPVMMLDPFGLSWDDHRNGENGWGGNIGDRPDSGPANHGCQGSCGPQGPRDPKTGQIKYGSFDDVLGSLGIGATTAVAASVPGCDVGCGSYPAAGDYQLAMADRSIVPIGDGWDLAIDGFNFKGQAAFEVHVRYDGKVVGTFNIAGEEIKENDIKLEKAIPQHVKDAALAETEARLRASGLLREGETLRGLTVEQRMGITNTLYGRVKMGAPTGSILRSGAGRLLNGLSALGMGVEAWSRAQELYDNDIAREQGYDRVWY